MMIKIAIYFTTLFLLVPNSTFAIGGGYGGLNKQQKSPSDANSSAKKAEWRSQGQIKYEQCLWKCVIQDWNCIMQCRALNAGPNGELFQPSDFRTVTTAELNRSKENAVQEINSCMKQGRQMNTCIELGVKTLAEVCNTLDPNISGVQRDDKGVRATSVSQ